MAMKRFLSTAATFGLCISLSIPAVAQTAKPAPAPASSASRPPPAPMTPPPRERTVNGITYIAGGIGDGESAALREAAPNYSMMIEFLEVEPGSQRGNWTADVAVEVKSGNQTLASFPVQGPLLLLRMAPGKYTLEATHADVKLTKAIEIKPKAKPLRERFVWRAAAGSLGGDLKSPGEPR